MNNDGNPQAYYLRRIGVAAPIADAIASDAKVADPKATGVINSEAPANEAGAQSVAVSKTSTPQPVPQPVMTPSQARPGPVVVQPTPAVESPAVTLPEPVAARVHKHPAESLDELRLACAGCTDCGLSQSRKQVVFGVGNEHPDVLFIGEAPGQQEDQQGEPFVGKAGHLLDRMLGALHWSRDQVYIMNVIKCRPPGNRDPQPVEVTACSQWFDAQWDLLQPKVVCLLGRVAAQRVLQSDAPLSALRGRWHSYRGVPVWVTYHPAYLLRTPSGKAAVWKDLRVLAARSRALKQGH